MSLYDRLFKPRRYTLPNGAVVGGKRSRAPLVILIVLALGALSVHITGFDFGVLVKKGQQVFRYPRGHVPAQHGVSEQDLAAPVGHHQDVLPGFVHRRGAGDPLCRSRRQQHRHQPRGGVHRPAVSQPCADLPTLVCALIATYIFGLGTMAGTCAIAVFTFAYMGKQLFEIIETVDMGL